MCCVSIQNITTEKSKIAGKWSDYRSCDTPWEMLTDALEQIKKNHPKIDYIYNTGDIVDHGVWATTPESIIEVNTKVFNLLKKAFGEIPIYSTIGNHDTHPCNM